MVPVYALLLFGGEVAVDHGAGRIRVDGWAEFKVRGGSRGGGGRGGGRGEGGLRAESGGRALVLGVVFVWKGRDAG